MISIKKLLVTSITSGLLLSKHVFANDCSEVESVISYLGNDFKNTYNTNDCCKFNGVTCDGDNNVTGIKFNNINGSQSDIEKVFEALANLKHLTSLDLSGNGFSGYLPYGITKLTSLKDLDLSNNKFNGTIPYNTKYLENLENLNLEGNLELYGYVPIKNIKTCSYESTALCNLPNALCKTASRDCTIEDVNNTNSYNGYPMQANQDKNIIGSNGKALKIYYDEYIYSAYNEKNVFIGNNNSNNFNDDGNPDLFEDDYKSSIYDLFRSLIGLAIFSLISFIFFFFFVYYKIHSSRKSSIPKSLYTTNPSKFDKTNRPISTTINIGDKTYSHKNTIDYNNTEDITNLSPYQYYSFASYTPSSTSSYQKNLSMYQINKYYSTRPKYGSSLKYEIKAEGSSTDSEDSR